MHYRIPALAVVLTLLFAPIVAHAVQFGWQQLPDGGIEYVVQVEPELLDSFKHDGFSSDIPASLQRDLRRIRIVVGNSKLPNEGDVMGPKTSAPSPTPTPAARLDSSAMLNSQSAPPNQPATLPPNSAAPPLLSAESIPSTISLPLPPTSASPTSAPSSQQPSASTFTDSLPPPPPLDEHPSQPKTESPAAEPSRSLSSLPFMQSGLISKVAGTNSPSNAQITTPRLNENELPPADYRSQDRALATGAAKPAVSDSPFAANPPAAAKPWLPLMGALLALFASLGANVYLAWIHQGVRTKYRALVQRVSPGSVAVV